MSQSKQAILRKYGLTAQQRLSSGMEAEVYALPDGRVLKLYEGTADLASLTVLQQFYASLQGYDVGYALPHIFSVAQEGNVCVTIERHLPGVPMASIMAVLASADMERLMQTYLSAVLALRAIPMPPEVRQYKLFDENGLSLRRHGDWHTFLARWLAQKNETLAPYFQRDVNDFAAKRARMRDLLAQPYTGRYCLVHGDFFPGNLLVNPQCEVTALLDFGLFTLWGDPLFDVATAWVFFDMYDDLKVNLRQRLLEVVLARLGEETRGVLYRYVLIYSLLSANTYAPDCSDGHYRWCVANLNHQPYWDGMA
jgi:aminoglycoside phosphotransferase (APT) family kinase protein